MSEGGKAFTFGHPSADSVLQRCLRRFSSTEFKGDDRRNCWWNRPIEDLDFEELQPFASAVSELRGKVDRRFTDLNLVQGRSRLPLIDSRRSIRDDGYLSSVGTSSAENYARNLCASSADTVLDYPLSTISHFLFWDQN